MRDSSDWKSQAATLRFPDKAFIAGKFVPAVDGQTFSSVNPATGKVLAQVAACSAEDVDLAVKAARHAYEKVWSKLPGAERGGRCPTGLPCRDP